MISELWTWAEANTGLPVIWANQNGPQPEPPYVTLNVIATSREGLPYIGEVDETGLVVIGQGQLFTLSLQVYGEGVTGAVQGLRDSLERITVQRDLRSSGFAYVRVFSEPQDVPEITGTTWQQRANMDIQFRAARDITDDVGLIETVAHDGGDGNASGAGAITGGA